MASLCSSVINLAVQTNQDLVAQQWRGRFCKRANEVDWPNRNFSGTNGPCRTNNRFTVTVTVEIACRVNRNYDRSLYANHARNAAVNDFRVRKNKRRRAPPFNSVSFARLQRATAEKREEELIRSGFERVGSVVGHRSDFPRRARELDARMADVGCAIRRGFSRIPGRITLRLNSKQRRILISILITSRSKNSRSNNKFFASRICRGEKKAPRSLKIQISNLNLARGLQRAL